MDEGRGKPTALTVSPRRMLIGMGMVIGLLLVLHLAAMSIAYGDDGQLTPDEERYLFFDVDYEVSLPTWWQQTVLLALGVLAMAIAHRSATTGDRDAARWRVLAGILVFMSVDEGTEIHGRLTEPVRDVLGIESGPLYYAWVIPGIVIVGLLGWYFYRFWTRLPSKPRWWLAAAGVVYVTGAVGVEIVGAAYESANGKDYGWSLLTAVEEALEMVGQALAVYALFMVLGGFGRWTSTFVVTDDAASVTRASEPA